MHLFLTSVLPFLAHDHASAAAFLTCRHHNFHASIIPEFLSDEERVKSFCEARQQNQKNKLPSCYNPDKDTQYANLYNLFVQTPLMQFSPSLIVFHQGDCAYSNLKQLLETKYFARTLQRCSFRFNVGINMGILQCLSKVRSLTKLDLGSSHVKNPHLEIIINSFPSLETLVKKETVLFNLKDRSKPAVKIISPPPRATKTLRSLELRCCDALFVTQFVSNFPNLRKLNLSGHRFYSANALDLLPLSSSLPLLTDLELEEFTLKNTESLNDLVLLSSLQFTWCRDLELSFLTHENSLPELTTLCVNYSDGLSTSSFTPLSHVPNLQVLEASQTDFDNDCFQYLENMVHLRKLDLSRTKIAGDSRSLKTLMQNLFQLEELDLESCRIGNQGAIAGALYSTHRRLRILNLSECNLVDADLSGIGALKTTLEALDLSYNYELTNEALVHCKELVKLKTLKLNCCNDLSPLKECLNLEELDVSSCRGSFDDSFKVFSEDPESFPNLSVLDLSDCQRLSGNVFEHLSNNNHLVYQLKELRVRGMCKIISWSPDARDNIGQLKGLRRLMGFLDSESSDSHQNKLTRELTRSLKNVEYLY